MKLSKDTRLLGMNVVAHAQHFCDRMDENCPIDNAAKTRIDNILANIFPEIEVHPTEDEIYPIEVLIPMIVTMIEKFQRDAKNETEHPTLRNWSLFPSPSEFRITMKRLQETFDDLSETLTWYRQEKNLTKNQVTF